MARKSIKANKVSKRGRPSQKQEKQIILENNGPRVNSKEAAQLMARAVEIADNLPLKHPCLIRVMLPSHISGGFWLGLPTTFCQKHMGTSDYYIELEDEDGKHFETKYIGRKWGLSGGWQKFAVSHGLRKGDVLVFQKVEARHFKVHIVKPDGSKKVKSASEDSQMAEATSPTSSDLSEDISYIENHEGSESGDLFNYIDNYESGLESEDHTDLDMLEEADLSKSDVSPFDEVTCMDKFKVMFNGQNINSQIPELVLKKYYELCRSQKSYLHENVLESLNNQLVVGLISETVNLADAIKSCKMSTEECEVSKWDKSLQASEILGMKVGFMRSQVSKLALCRKISNVHKDAREAREQEEAELRRRLADLLKRKAEADREWSMKSLQLAASFKKLANVPW